MIDAAFPWLLLMASSHTSSREYMCTLLQGIWRNAEMLLQVAQLFVGFGIRFKGASDAAGSTDALFSLGEAG